MEHLITLITGPGGALVFALVILFGGLKKNPWWVFGWQYRDKDAEALYWREAALKATQTAERAVGVTTKEVS